MTDNKINKFREFIQNNRKNRKKAIEILESYKKQIKNLEYIKGTKCHEKRIRKIKIKSKIIFEVFPELAIVY